MWYLCHVLSLSVCLASVLTDDFVELNDTLVRLSFYLCSVLLSLDLCTRLSGNLFVFLWCVCPFHTLTSARTREVFI